MNKMILIGIDGATWDLVEPWIKEGKLPTFKKLKENGVWGELESTIPPWTVPAWNSISTGYNPSKLGFSTFMKKKKDSYRFLPYFFFKDNGIPPFWKILNNKGKTTNIFFLPNVHQPEKIKGKMITGFINPTEKITYPEDFKKELEKNVVEKLRIDVTSLDKNWHVDRASNSKLSRQEHSSLVREIDEEHFNILCYTLEKYQWDITFIVFSGSDRVQHSYWGEKTEILNYYKFLDKKIKYILNNFNNNTNFLFVSDHGFGPVKYTFNINRWLQKEGYLKLKKDYNSTYLRKLNSYLSQHKLLYELSKKIVGFIPVPNLQKNINKKLTPVWFEQIEKDWENTKVFAYGGFGDIYINLKGREPEGVVPLEKYNEIRDEIIEKLKDLSYPDTKKRVYPTIFKREDVYKDSNIEDNLPDLFILPTDEGFQSVHSGFGINQIFTNANSGQHRRNGFFLAYGPDIKSTGKELHKLRVYDITPTVLHMFGCSIPKKMDGRVLDEIFKEGTRLSERPIRYQKDGVKTEEDKIKSKIKNLQKTGKI